MHDSYGENTAMTGRVNQAEVAFTEIYDKDLWSLAHIPPEPEKMQHVADLLAGMIRDKNITSVTEFGCGFWSYQKLIDWTGINYNGYDVVPGAVRFNTNGFTTAEMHFHQMTDSTQLAPADLLFSKDVLQHLPVEDVLHFLAMFKSSFSYILLLNDILPEENLNGQIAPGGYRALRLDLPPFNEQYETYSEWDNPAFGVHYRKRACLLRGSRPLSSAAGA
jgi:hypothetical protein